MTGSAGSGNRIEELRRVVGDVPWGSRATLVQFSSVFCAPCRAMRLMLEDLVGIVPGVEHVEVDADSNPDLAFNWEIAATPTVVILGPDEVELARASGVPNRDQVLATLAAVLPEQ